MLVHSFTSSDREKPLSVLEGFLLSQLEEFMREIEKQPDDEVCCCCCCCCYCCHCYVVLILIQ